MLLRRPPRALSTLLGLAAVAAVAASCDRCGDRGSGKDAASDAPEAPASEVRASDASTARDADTAVDRDASTSAFDAAPTDAGPSPCRLAYGPAEQPFRGPAALVVAASELKLVVNEGGKPRAVVVPINAPSPSRSIAAPRTPASFVGVRWPPCEMAGRWAYCQGAGGTVFRTTLGGADTKQIAKSRPSTRIAAAPLGADHAVVATLETRHTTEGDRLEAFVTLDDGEAMHLSDDGAGATVVRLVPRGDAAVAVYLDSRTAMVPVHARPVSMRGVGLALGDDAVVFVAGPPERGVDVALAGTSRALFALLPIGRDSADFGMAAIAIAERPKDNVEPVWSMYPNGLDPAPVAGTVQAEDGAWVARVRPADRAASSPRILELGRIDASGAFRSLGAIASGTPITDVAMARDTFGSLWILYGDANATWLERRVCP